MDSGQDESADRPASGADAGAPSPGTEHDAQAGAQRDPASQDDAQSNTTQSNEAGAPAAGTDSDFGPPLSGFGPSLNDFGPPISVFGTAGDTFGPPSTEFGAPVADLGSAGEFGPPTGEFRPVPDGQVAGWSPAPAPASPELAWRPADGTPAAAPEYLAPDSSTPYPGDADALYGNGFDESEQTVRYDAEQTVRYDTAPESPAPKKKSGWATGGGIKTSQLGRESAWLRAADSGQPPSDSAAPQEESLSWADDPLTKMLMPKKAEPGKGGAGKSGKQESLSWADDPIAQRLAPKTAVPQAEPKKKSWMPIAVGAGALTLIVVVALVVVSLTRGDSGGGEDTQAAFGPGGTVTTAAPSSGMAALSCPSKREGSLTIGNGPGGNGSGADAILGFQHAFYADRDGAKARSFVTSDSPTVSPAEVIQQAIDEVIPKGTSYCLRITDLGADAYDADLTEHRPDGTTTVYRQRITTVNKDGKHLIFAIDGR
ncbi:hypothetical protein GFY24_15505 [Nocardia sp. SYP-A9097]|uniref:hypothetical protein n=1 Tax=Nocardia sp. SYP-A9097 TaxID=2663237 RepID=UPI00129B0FC8|nr:hypothetical protein [Nocardia sp. SYP-A9097]MRH88834.1 hypothetical protein [Nocardia sp. SYP-A9097]